MAQEEHKPPKANLTATRNSSVKPPTVTLDIPRVKRAEKLFPTGSSYNGTWDVLGMSGFGVYKFPSGVIYEGEFDDGMFHGPGQMRYPSGAVLIGKWKRGEMTERTLIFPDGMEYAEKDWTYCTMPDRRFTIEVDRGLNPAGMSYKTAEQPTRAIPPGYFDTVDGFYDGSTKVVYTTHDLTRIIRKPCPLEQKWIQDHCRTNPIENMGPRPKLYEEWSKPQMKLETEEPTGFHSHYMLQLTSKKSRSTEDKDSVHGFKYRSSWMSQRDDKKFPKYNDGIEPFVSQEENLQDTAFPYLRADSASSTSSSLSS